MEFPLQDLPSPLSPSHTPYPVVSMGFMRGNVSCGRPGGNAKYEHVRLHAVQRRHTQGRIIAFTTFFDFSATRAASRFACISTSWQLRLDRTHTSPNGPQTREKKQIHFLSSKTPLAKTFEQMHSMSTKQDQMLWRGAMCQLPATGDYMPVYRS